LGVVYTPKGPLFDWNNARLRNQVLADLTQFSKKKGGIFLKIDPDIQVGTGVPGEEDSSETPFGRMITDELKTGGWRFSQDQIQYRNTVLVDLQEKEEEMLARMKQKTRYNIRLAARKRVVVRAGAVEDLPLLYKMYAETSARDGFAIREKRYYLTLWKMFLEAGMMEPLIAHVEGEAVAAMCVFRFGGTAVYMHGMSLPIHRNKMPTYLLQWEAMRRAKAAGCAVYDLWGAPNVFDETDTMWGVFRFKRGLGGQVVRTVGAWDLPLKPLMYRLYTGVIPNVLEIMKNR
jgi:lipid II:glycine glycyltransferase (peptidoglycan interpeptide bridge formation enzyme)